MTFLILERTYKRRSCHCLGYKQAKKGNLSKKISSCETTEFER
jgi:hypothetical protein